MSITNVYYEHYKCFFLLLLATLFALDLFDLKLSNSRLSLRNLAVVHWAEALQCGS